MEIRKRKRAENGASPESGGVEQKPGDTRAVVGKAEQEKEQKRLQSGILTALAQYFPWLLLLLGVDAFAILLLWLANTRAFYALAVVILMATVILFCVVCAGIVYQERRRSQAFFAFLEKPDLQQEEQLTEAAGPAFEDEIRLLGETLRSYEAACAKGQTQLEDYEEYMELWAHEIKTPISLLTFLLDNRREELPDALCLRLDYIRNQLQESVNQLLYYARLKSARKDYRFEHLRLREVIDEILEDYRPLLEEKQFVVRVELEGESVYSDRRGLQFLLGQLVSNSIRYSAGRPELCFSCAQREKRCVLSVRDNGIGVRACDLPYLFEKGFTGDTGTERKKATGMGLYLAEEMAKELNLTLQVNSEWGKGFEMQVAFPAVERKDRRIADASDEATVE